jgi:hypothetical protein
VKIKESVVEKIEGLAHQKLPLDVWASQFKPTASFPLFNMWSKLALLPYDCSATNFSLLSSLR